MKTFEVKLIFDTEDSAHGFTAYWLDGGGDGGGNLDWDTTWKKKDVTKSGAIKVLRIKGTGNPNE
jgi:hypothetical protein